jgi:Arc/MetJ-type ribon-helix-helix transcriptional regulator
MLREQEMTLNLKTDLEAKIAARVSAGSYQTPEDVIAAALQALEQNERLGDFEPGELDALCQIGIDQLDRGESLDAEDVFREINALQNRSSTGSGQ